MTFAFVVSTPGVGDLAAALDLARAALACGHEVGVFVMSDAVRALHPLADAVAAFVREGGDLRVCATSVEAHAVPAGALAEGLTLGSQDDHAALLHGADRVLAFT